MTDDTIIELEANAPEQDQSSELERAGLPAAVKTMAVIYGQIADLVPAGLAYYRVRYPDGSQAAFPDQASALAAVSARGGSVDALPTRAALRLIGAAGSVSAEPVDTKVVASAEGATQIANPLMSMVILQRGSEYSVICTVVLRSGDRVMPAVGAASTDEWTDRRSEAPLGRRLAHAIEIASTRAMNRGIADLTGLPVLGTQQVERQESPQVVILREARRLGISPGRIKEILGKRVDQIGSAEVSDALAKLAAAAEDDKPAE